MDKIESIWKRIEAWLDENAQEIASGLRTGASEEQITQAEQELGIQFPTEVRASYKYHNGQERDSYGLPIGGGLIDAQDFLSQDGILEQWRMWKSLLDAGTFADSKSEPSPEIKSDWWNPKWIPLTHNGGGDHICLDMDPTSDGSLGQIITMWHDMDERTVIANSFTEWLEEIAQEMENGEQVYSEDYGGIARADSM